MSDKIPKLVIPRVAIRISTEDRIGPNEHSTRVDEFEKKLFEGQLVSAFGQLVKLCSHQCFVELEHFMEM